jgi:phage tail-like protein
MTSSLPAPLPPTADQLAVSPGISPLRAGEGSGERSNALAVPGTEVSNYVQYLPGPFAADPFLGRYLMIVETILGSIERTIDNIPHYFDPSLTPEEMLPWLASWVDHEVDENAPLLQRRRAVSRAAGLYRWQGTRRALREHIQEHTGRAPLIVENCDGMRLGQDAMLGVNTSLGSPRPHTVAITALVDRLEDVDEGVLQRIVEREKPVHVGYTLEIRELPAQPPALPILEALDGPDLPAWPVPGAPGISGLSAPTGVSASGAVGDSAGAGASPSEN